VFLLCAYPILSLSVSALTILSSDAASGVIRLYDGRGHGTPLQVVDSVHRFPVHVMTVSSCSPRVAILSDLAPV
jgi:hypothetical protein